MNLSVEMDVACAAASMFIYLFLVCACIRRGHQLVQASGAEDQAWEAGPYQGTLGSVENFLMVLPVASSMPLKIQVQSLVHTGRIRALNYFITSPSFWLHQVLCTSLVVYSVACDDTKCYM